MSERGVPRGLAAACVGAGLVTFAIGALDCLNFAVDDSFISLRYAENWAHGLGLVFNPGERVEGFSNLLWTLVLGALARSGLDQAHGPYTLLIAAKLLGAALACLALLVLAWHVFTSARSAASPARHPLAALAVAGAGGTFSFALWSLSGMETGLCTFLVTVAGVMMMRLLRRHDAGEQPSPAAALATGSAFGLLTLVRPEPVVIWGVTMLLLFAAAPAPVRRTLIVAAIPTLLVFAAATLWRLGYYGEWVPNSVVAKSGGGLTYALLGIKYALAAVVGSIGVLALAAFALPAIARLGLEARFLVVYCMCHVAFVAVSGGDWMPGFRFLVPLLPLLWLLCTSASLELVRAFAPALDARAVALVFVGLAIASMMNGRALARAQMEFPTGFKQRTWVGAPERVTAARELAASLPAGSLVAIGECGYIPYYAPGLCFLDVFGLMDKRIARLPGAHTHKLTLAEFLARDPDDYLMMTRLGPGGIVPSHPDGELLVAAPEFRARYHEVRTFPGFTLFARTAQASR